jgi:hypothetical protein
MHRNSQRDKLIPSDAKTQVQSNVSRGPYYGNNTGPTRAQKKCVDVSQSRRTGIHNMTRRSHRMQQHKFGITCPGALYMETALSPPIMKNCASMFRAQTHQNALCDPQIPPDQKTQVHCNVCWHGFFGNHIGRTRA